ncbi:MAG: beta-ketoacyl-ACP synthase II [Lentisphaerae bacterium]|nr:beta-ketoacyl-ACP synthase II [Lentisphaerota bacterium]
MRRAVITGIGVISPLGCALETFWTRMVAGTSGIRRITRFDVSKGYDSQIAGEVVEFDIDAFIAKKEQRRMDVYCHYAVAASQLAVTDAGLDFSKEDPTRIGSNISSGIGGLETLQTQHSNLVLKGPDRCSPFMIPQMISNMAAGLVAIRFNLQGPSYCIVSACASAAHAIGMAQRHIRLGEADIMIAGGAEAAACELGVAGFGNMKALSTRNDDPTRASRPFDRDRDGFVIGEGAGVVVVEEYEHAKARGARIYCEVAGFGQSCDASHITAPMESGEAGARAMTLAMKDAQLTPGDIQYINAHGTSTPLNDKTETKVIKLAMGDAARTTMISSTKSMTGHLLGAAGGIEAAVCALAIQRGVIPPTINLENPDPNCDLDYTPNTARQVPVRAALKNSLGFGGHNVCLAFTAVS